MTEEQKQELIALLEQCEELGRDYDPDQHDAGYSSHILSNGECWSVATLCKFVRENMLG